MSNASTNVLRGEILALTQKLIKDRDVRGEIRLEKMKARLVKHELRLSLKMKPKEKK